MNNNLYIAFRQLRISTLANESISKIIHRHLMWLPNIANQNERLEFIDFLQRPRVFACYYSESEVQLR